MDPISAAFGLFNQIQSATDAAYRKKAAYRYGEVPGSQISDASRIALSTAKLRAGEVGLNDEEEALRQGQLAGIEDELGLSGQQEGGIFQGPEMASSFQDDQLSGEPDTISMLLKLLQSKKIA